MIHIQPNPLQEGPPERADLHPADAEIDRLRGQLNSDVPMTVEDLHAFWLGLPEEHRDDLLFDLICEHLGPSWRQGCGVRLEDYVRVFDDPKVFRSLEDVPADVVECEFLARHRAGRRADHPRLDEYELRFRQCPHVIETLRAKLLGDRRYVRLSVLGEGGLGRVWLSYDYHLERLVAIKIPKPELASDETLMRRIRQEARLTARLNHPAIVSIHECVDGTTGQPFYVMPVVSGWTLQEQLDRFHQQRDELPDSRLRLAWREWLQRLVTVCDAIQYAHEQGIIHRDLKPANIKVGPYGETTVLDWGLARIMGQSEPAPAPAHFTPVTIDQSTVVLQTDDTSVSGTPGFMAPEQVSSLRSNQQSDVYALGAILYYILTGRSTLPLDSNMSKLQLLAWLQAPVIERPRGVNRQIPRPLEAICLKALHRQPQRRYGTARQFQEDLECYLADEPVRALPESWLAPARIFRWLRRHRQVMAVMGVLLAMLLLVGGWQWYAARTRAGRSRQSQDVADTALASEFLKQGRADQVLALLRPWQVRRNGVDPRDWEYHYLARATHGNQRALAATGRPIRALAILNPQTVAVAVDRTVEVWTHDGRRIARLQNHSGLVNDVASSPDGRTLASVSEDGRLVVWDVASAQARHVLTAHLTAANTVAFNQAGSQLVTGGDCGVVHVWDTATGDCRATLVSPYESVSGAAFVSGKPRIAVIGDAPLGERRDFITVWDPASDNPPHRLEMTSQPLVLATSHRQSKVAVICGDHQVRIWDLDQTDGAPLSFGIGSSSIASVRFVRDDQELLCGSGDRRMLVFDLDTRQLARQYLGHRSSVAAVDWHPADGRFVSAGRDGTIRWWDGDRADIQPRATGHIALVRKIQFFPDGSRLASGSWDRTIRIWDLQGKQVATLGRSTAERDSATGGVKSFVSTGGHEGLVADIAIRSDGLEIATAGFNDNTVMIWDVATREARATLPHPLTVEAVAYRDQHSLATACWDRIVRVWDTRSQSELLCLQGHEAEVHCLAFSPDGSLLVSGSEDRSVRIWNARNGDPLQVLDGHPDSVRVVAFSLDGRLLATGCDDGLIRLWRRQRGRFHAEPQILRGHLAGVRSLSFSPDGKRLASASQGDEIRLWNLHLGVSTCALQGRLNVCFSPDGNQLAVCDAGNDIRLLDGSALSTSQQREWLADITLDPPPVTPVIEEEPAGGLRALGYALGKLPPAPNQADAGGEPDRLLLVVLSFPVLKFQPSLAEYEQLVAARREDEAPLPPRENLSRFRTNRFRLLLADGRRLEPAGFSRWPTMSLNSSEGYNRTRTSAFRPSDRGAVALVWRLPADAASGPFQVCLDDYAAVAVPERRLPVAAGTR